MTGRRATSHRLALGLLPQYGAEPSGDRGVLDGKYVTAAGVSSGIDMGLTLVGRIAGDEHTQAVQLLTEYDPQPPYDAGAPHKASAHLGEEFHTNSRFGSLSGGGLQGGVKPVQPEEFGKSAQAASERSHN